MEYTLKLNQKLMDTLTSIQNCMWSDTRKGGLHFYIKVIEPVFDLKGLA